MELEFTELQWTDFLPAFHEFCPVAILLIAGFSLRREEHQQTAWELVAIAWFWVLYNVVYGIMRATESISVSGNGDLLAMITQALQEGVYFAVISAVTLPLLVSIPIACLLLFRSRSRPRGVMRWVYASLALSVLDTILFVAMVSLTVGTWGRN